MKKNTYFYYLISILRETKNGTFFFFSLVICSILSAVSESIGIFALIPLFDIITGDASEEKQFIIRRISSLLDGLSTKDKLLTIACFIFISSLFKAIFEFCSRVLGNVLQISIAQDLTKRSFDEFFKTSIPFVERNLIGRLRVKMINLPNRIAQIILQTTTITSSLILFAFYSVLLTITSIEMTLISSGVILTVLLLSVVLAKIQRINGEKLTEVSLYFSALTFDILKTMKLVRLTVSEEKQKTILLEALNRQKKITFAMNKISSLGQPIFTVAGGTFMALVIILGVYFKKEAPVEWLPLLVIFMVVLYRMMGPVSQINAARLEINSNLPAIDGYLEFISECNKNPQPSGRKNLQSIDEEICFKNVSFNYKDIDVPVLTNISVTFKKGETVGIVGKSGSGKTTVVNLLCKLLEPTSGKIMIDGVNLSEITHSSWMKKISLVTQETIFKSSSILENIRFAESSIGFNKVLAASKSAQAHEFIMDFPEKYNHKVGENGNQMSGGQRQRLSLARALLTDPEILILDEATSQLDNMTQEDFQRVIDNFRGNKTIFIIAHQIKSVMNADKIIVLENGRIIESGTHSQLMSKNQEYARFVTLQSIE